MNISGFSLRVIVALISTIQATLSAANGNEVDLNHPESNVSKSKTYRKYSDIPIMKYLYPIDVLTVNFFSFS